MRSKPKALPYPVLGRADDFTDSEFQSLLDAVVNHSEDGDRLVIEYRFFLSSPEVLDVVSSGRARYALDIQCSDTLYRNVVHCETSGKIEFKRGELYGRVEIQPCIVATSIISDFRASDLNPEFGESTVSFQPGDVFAIDDAQVRFVEFDRMKLESLVSAKLNDTLQSYEYKAELDGDIILIEMGSGCKRVWDHFRSDSEVAPFLAMSIYKDCLHAALFAIATDESASELRWARALNERLMREGIQISRNANFNSLSMLAQRLVANIGIQRVIRNVD